MRTKLEDKLEPIMRALADMENQPGRDIYRKPFDKALHIYSTLHHSGFRVVRAPAARKGGKL